MSKMYAERVKNIPAFRGCDFNCVYCAFKRLVQMNKKCSDCAEFKPHTHLEALDKTPPKTKEGDFLTIGLSGDISFANIANGEMLEILDYVCKWSDRTFLLQSKNPAFFLNFVWPKNVILGTTIETNRQVLSRGVGDLTYYHKISKAPHPILRQLAIAKLLARKAVTIEPVLLFDDDILMEWILRTNPEIVWIGYDSSNHKLPEPSLLKTQAFVSELQRNGVNIHTKLMRKAWWE